MLLSNFVKGSKTTATTATPLPVSSIQILSIRKKHSLDVEN